MTLYYFIKKNFHFYHYNGFPKILQDHIQYHFDHENRRGGDEKMLALL